MEGYQAITNVSAAADDDGDVDFGWSHIITRSGRPDRPHRVVLYAVIVGLDGRDFLQWS